MTRERSRGCRRALLGAALAFGAGACTLAADWDGIHEDAPVEARPPAPSSDVPYANEVLAADPVAYYRFEEASGDIARSEIAGAPDGMLRGGATRGTGLVGRGVDLDGVDGHVDFGRAFAFVDDAREAFTIELVVRVDRVDDDYARIFSREWRVDGDTLTGVLLFSHVSNLGFRRVNVDPATSEVDLSRSMGTFGGKPLAAGRVTHLATTCDAATCRLFVDGALVGGNGAPAGESVEPRDRIFVVGRAAPAPNALRGAVDELAVYRRALGADVVARHAALVAR